MAHFDVHELAEQAWKGELDLVFQHHPVHTVYEGAAELAPGVLAAKGLAGIYVFDTGAGLVMLDAGTLLDVDRVYESVRAWRPNDRLAAAVFSHHHVDHIFATVRFEQEAAEQGWQRPTVYGHELMPAHFDRYLATRGWNTAINRRQFAIDVPHFAWPDHYRYPDVVFASRLTFTQGDLTFELHHGRGETDDHVWTWVPERRMLHSGDLFIYAVPNGGNPQKVQRYVSDWAAALNEMAALGADILLPGHGLPIFGADRVREALTTTAALLQSIEDQTIALMNQGLSLDEVLNAVDLPADLMARPYLRPVYDHPEFLVRMVWRRYGGWWDGEFDTLLPAPKAAQAAEWAALAGGVATIVSRAEALSAEGNHQLACHLVEAARHAAPGDPGVHAARTAIYRAWSQQHTSSMARNILHHAALASEKGLRDLASGR